MKLWHHSFPPLDHSVEMSLTRLEEIHGQVQTVGTELLSISGPVSELEADQSCQALIRLQPQVNTRKVPF